MNYLRIPNEVSIEEIRNKDASLSAGMYRRAIIPTKFVEKLSGLLNTDNPFDKGVEPGSLWYLRHSTHYFIRTKALQEYSCLLYPKGEAIVPINPRVFQDIDLNDGDILMAKDSNVGECAIIDGTSWKNCMFSGGIVRLHPAINRWYLFSFLKHSLFKSQLQAMTARGATISHAKTLWLDCIIPFPKPSESDSVMKYVSALMQAIVEKEIAIRDNSNKIHSLIQTELIDNQKREKFDFQMPSIKEIINSKRLDAAIYDKEYKSKIWLIKNYIYGWQTPSEDGFKVTPGPSLEIKVLGTRQDSVEKKPGWYALIIPTNISLYGTMNAITFLGTAKKLPLLQQGDVVFGEAGYQKGRSIVLLEGIEKCTTNAHGLYARRSDGNVNKSVFFRCIFNWYRNMRLIDLMAVGGSGGHFSPEYFDYVAIPKFPEEKQREIVQLYHNPSKQPAEKLTLDNFVEWHKKWNKNLGIWELDREMKTLQQILLAVQEDIINGNSVNIPI